MKQTALRSTLLTLFGACLLVLCVSPQILADSPLKSSHYEIDETIVGGGGLPVESSTNFQAGESIGDIGIGNSASSNYQINAGFETTNDPALGFSVSNTGANFPDFSPTAASVTTSTFQVSDYTSYGYVVQIIGTPPANGSHVISAMASTGASQTGIEQFGINLVANTSPASFGANPNNGSFGFGAAGSNYASANNFRYVSGETIASAPKSSGVTLYTISYIINVSSITPGGIYKSNQTLICIGTY